MNTAIQTLANEIKRLSNKLTAFIHEDRVYYEETKDKQWTDEEFNAVVAGYEASIANHLSALENLAPKHKLVWENVGE